MCHVIWLDFFAALIDDVSREDTEVLSRAEVKSRSAKIVEQNQKSEFDVPAAEKKWCVSRIGVFGAFC